LLEAVVILVEDEELLQVSIDRSLKDGGFDVLTVASADEAMALLKSGVVKYSALVIDIYLKDGGSGWDVARLAFTWKCPCSAEAGQPISQAAPM